MEVYDDRGNEINCNGDVIYVRKDKKGNVVRDHVDEEAARVMTKMVLFGGHDVGIMTNPDLKNRLNYVEINGERVVCLAQAGECRVSGQFYSISGLSNPDNWKTPVASESCPDECPKKYLVCDGHNHEEDSDVGIFIINPDRNKFAGQFTRFCKDFDRIH